MLAKLQALPASLLGITLAGALAVAIGGCGDDTTAKYKKDLNKDKTQLQGEFNAAGKQLQTASTPAARAAGLDALANAFNKAGDDFAALKPPDKAKAANSQLVDELHGFAADIQSVKAALGSQNAKGAQQSVAKIQGDEGKIQATLNDLKAKVGG